MNENETYLLLVISSIILWYTTRFIEAEKIPITKEQAYSIFNFQCDKSKNNQLQSPQFKSIVETLRITNLV